MSIFLMKLKGQLNAITFLDGVVILKKKYLQKCIKMYSSRSALKNYLILYSVLLSMGKQIWMSTQIVVYFIKHFHLRINFIAFFDKKRVSHALNLQYIYSSNNIIQIDMVGQIIGQVFKPFSER